jgi:hypothetical protein
MGGRRTELLYPEPLFPGVRSWLCKHEEHFKDT